MHIIVLSVRELQMREWRFNNYSTIMCTDTLIGLSFRALEVAPFYISETAAGLWEHRKGAAGPFHMNLIINKPFYSCLIIGGGAGIRLHNFK